VRQHGGSEVNVDIRTGLAGTGELRLTVSDDGPGISEANAKRIFQPFFTTARDQGGTGLGLAVVKSLLTAHRGSIQLAASQPGAVFEIRLPLAVPPSRARGPSSE
jgi:signal transduction histidine kinase